MNTIPNALREISANELQSVEGGVLPAPIGAIVAAGLSVVASVLAVVRPERAPTSCPKA